MKCWGSDYGGALGNGGGSTNFSYSQYLGAPEETPINLGSGRTAVAVSAGLDYACAILDNGDMKCWGRGGAQLGYNSNDGLDVPAETPINLGDNRTAAAMCT